MSQPRRLLWCAALLMAVCLLADPAWACPTCKESLAHSDPASANMVRGYFWSILFMMSMPFLILASLSAYFYYQVRQARMEQRKEGAWPTASAMSSY